MSVSRSLLGLLERQPQYGYTLRRRYDRWFAGGHPVASAQVYSSLRRLADAGFTEQVGVEPGGGPDRRMYGITGAGVDELERWLGEPELPDLRASRQILFAKIVVALLTSRQPQRILERQRQTHMARMRQLRDVRATGEPIEQLDADFEMFHLDADLRWIDAAGPRIERIRATLREDPC
jgi:DNA-binding PadR family transcriptional regulator